jgi:DNA polymerase I-like protein with 3'-5' exonuclease and polymerase domains
MSTAVFAAPSAGTLFDLDEIRERTEALAAARLPIGLDCETGYLGDSREGASLHPEENFIVSVQFTNDMSWARMIPLGFERGPNVDNRAAAALLWPLFHAVDDEGLPLVVAHGAQAELRWLARWFLRNLWDHPLFGAQVRASHGYYPVRSCTLLESFAEGRNPSHGLKNMTAMPPERGGFGHQMRELKDGADSLLGKLLGRKPTKQEGNSVRFNVFDPTDPEVAAYACEDSVYALGHHLARWPKVRGSFIYKLEMSVLPIVCEAADTGLAYDWEMLRATSEEVRDFADLLLAEVVEDFEALAGERLPPNFNFGSSQQLSDLFYEKCSLPIYHRTKAGRPSIDAKKALPRLIAEVPEVAKYNKWRRLNTLRNNYLEIYEAKYRRELDGRAHPLLVQHGTIGGRFSCEDPNAQQPPGKYSVVLRDGTSFKFNFRDVIIPSPPGRRPWYEQLLLEVGCTDLPEVDQHGWYILGGDYSQIELRVLAAEAGETELLEAFERGEDVHKLTASRMLGIPLDEVTPEQRQDTGKRMNFAIGYGLSDFGMAEQTGMPIEKCRELFAAFHRAYPKLKPFTRSVVARARRDGFVITKFGRRVTFHDIHDVNPKVRSAEERSAGNAVIQGPATGDYVKAAMVRARRALEKAGMADRVRLIMNIHDALEYEVRDDLAPADVIAVLQPAVVFPVTGPGVAWPTLVMDWHVGVSWGQKKEIEVLADGSVRVKKEEKKKPASPSVSPPVTSPEPARDVIVLAGAVPTRDQVQAFGRYLKSLPGGNSVELQLPTGEHVPVGFRCGLTPEHEAQVSGILGAPAAVHYALGPADASALADSSER